MDSNIHSHTPGPWRLDLWPNAMNREEILSACIVEEDGGVIASLGGWDEMNEADAMLMAAAPLMYLALDDALGLLVFLKNGNDVGRIIEGNIAQILRVRSIARGEKGGAS